MVPRTQKLNIKTGPVVVDTSFLTSSLEGKGVAFLNSRNPRDMLAIGIGAIFGPCGAAELGASIEEIEELIEETDRTVEYYRQLARTLARRDGGTSLVQPSIVSAEPMPLKTKGRKPKPEPENEPEPELEVEPAPAAMPTYTYVEEEDDL